MAGTPYTVEEKKLIRLVRDSDEINKYKKLLSFMSGDENYAVLPMQQDIFKPARKIFNQTGVYLIAVAGDQQACISDNCLFFLISKRDISEHDWGVSEINVNYNGENLKDLLYVDTALIDAADTYIFDEVEEYTYALTEFIRQTYPEKLIIYLDTYARYFWNESDKFVYLNSIRDISNIRIGRSMYIKSDSTIHMYSGVPEVILNIFSSENVINSLCWAKNISELGPLNADKVILLIDCDFGMGAGLAYIVRTVCIYAIMAYERGWIPVVNLMGANMYIDYLDDNMWEQYFKPVSNISVRDALRSRNVICIRKNQPDYRAIWVNPYFRSIWYQGAKFDVFLKEVLIEQFDSTMPFPIRDKNTRVLGVVARGTDKPGLKKSTNNTERMLEECRNIFERGEFDKLFLATEDKDYYDTFLKEFGDKLISIDQKRVTGGELIGRQLNIPQGKRSEFGRTYLLITYCLSGCNAILYNFKVGAYFLMDKWRKTPFEFECQIGKEKAEHGLDNLSNCLEFIEQHTITAIYGTGDVGDKLFIYLKKLLKKVVFVDKKACSGNYFFHDIRVMTPMELTAYCSKKKVDGIVLATSEYAEEIETEIRKNGIEVGRIMRIGIEDFAFWK